MVEAKERVKSDEKALFDVLLGIEAGIAEPTTVHISGARFCIQRLLKRMCHIN